MSSPPDAKAPIDKEAVAPRLKSGPDSKPQSVREVCLRSWKPGDRVQLRYSGGARKVKEILERMHVTGSARANWPVLELDGRILWMQGVQAEGVPGIEVLVSPLEAASPDAPREGEIAVPE